ncbi:Fur family transcriptional regulator [Compostibacter hankyongensis]|uniref:Fur family transcriptional regulator n=1 Tax=Compostibacter hankyongensis TaxID=1007089 RepID=A0ABP8FZH9_9BACT
MMKEVRSKYAELLEKHGLSKTPPRLNILSILTSRKVATPESYLEKKLGDRVDRVTLYRTLKTFEEKGILHKVLDQKGTANYAVCSEKCSEHRHYDEHMHFNCLVCNRVYCMDEIEFAPVKLPRGFKAKSINLTITGICRQCEGKSR